MTSGPSSDRDERASIGQLGPSAELPPVTPTPSIPPAEMSVVRQDAPPPATPPAPPGSGIVAWLQRMPLGGRWALGLGLALLSGFIAVAWPSGWSGINYVLMLALALAAGITLTNWWAALALDAVTMAGAFVGMWVNVQVAPGQTILGLTGMDAVLSWFAFWAVFSVLPLLILFLGGVGLGKTLGLSLGRPHTPSAGEATASRWIAALAPALVSGYLAFNYSSVIQVDPTALAQGRNVWTSVVSLLIALVFSATCLLAGWLLRSWWGALAATIAYAGPPFVMFVWSGGYGVGKLAGWLVIRFTLYILLPAVVMSVIGTVLSMRSASRGGERQQRPQAGLLAT